jgi:molecular chaperone GrpE
VTDTKQKHLNRDETEAAEAATTTTNGAAPETEALSPEPDLATVASERDSYLDQLQRSLAEFANYRRRVEQERAFGREIATRDLLRQLVPIVDDLKRALESVPEDQMETPWVQGVGLIERKLLALLEREGVTPIEAEGQPFDPAFHEAVASDPGSSGDTVVEVYQAGYKHRNALLRPAMVRVGDQPKAPESTRTTKQKVSGEQPAANDN